MELEVSIGQKEQTDVQHNIFMEMNRLLEEPFNLSSQGEKEKTTTDDEVEEAYKVQRGDLPIQLVDPVKETIYGYSEESRRMGLPIIVLLIVF